MRPRFAECDIVRQSETEYGSQCRTTVFYPVECQPFARGILFQ